MSGISQSLGRTVKTNIILYTTDNKGRDGYITYNNGGFWKDNIKQIKLKSNYPRNTNQIFHSLIHQAAPFNYYSDGKGRDTYVLKDNAGLVKEFNPLANRQKLSKYLRRYNIPFYYDKKINNQRIFLTPTDKENYLRINEIQKNVVGRLYNQSLEKFRKKMKCKSPLIRDSINSLNNSKNFSNLGTDHSLFTLNNQRSIKNKINEKITKKILKFKLNKTSNNSFKKDNKNSNIPNLKNNHISDNNLVNYFQPNKTCKNLDIKNSFNNWNPIITKYNSINNSNNNTINNNINEYQRKKITTFNNEINEKKKNEKSALNQTDLYEIEKNNTMKLGIYKERPKSYRRLFQKRQIFNRFKPFLVDDFQEYSDYE